MWFEQIVRRETGCATYMVGCAEVGECAVYDPLWDPAPYEAMAQSHGCRIRYVIDSHSHADHVSGARRLVENTGAELILPVLAEIEYSATRVSDRDRLEIGGVTLEMVHTPGHRPEQMSVLITDHSRSEDPVCMLTADFLMVGDMARPDLAQGGVEGARIMFDQAIPALADLPDFLEIYPGHTAGST